MAGRKPNSPQDSAKDNQDDLPMEAKPADEKADDDKIKEIIDANKALYDQNEALKKEIASLVAKSVPVSKEKTLDAEDKQIGKDGVAQFVGDELVRPVMGDVDDPVFKEKLAYEEFMNEPVEVMVTAGIDYADTKVVDISVNGKTEIFPVGQRRVVKRYFVEGLARAKKTGYENVEFTDEKGVKGYKWPGATGLRYAFSVTDDKNPRGRDWLLHILAQP